jgi:transcription elongation factor GreB
MNKAFVKESDDTDDDLELGQPDVPAGTKNYITPQGHQRLRDELLQLLDTERPEVVRLVSWAASNGDRSENGDYIYGKRRLREIDRRVRFLRKRLEGMVGVEQPPADPARVFFGAWVELEDEDGTRSRHRIVGPDEFDMASGYISMDSPLGRALLSRRLEEEVVVATPSGSRTLVIVAIDYEPGGPTKAPARS